jgi:putative DNA methylase
MSTAEKSKNPTEAAGRNLASTGRSTISQSSLFVHPKTHEINGIHLNASAPSLTDQPVTERRLIDDGLMHFEASQAGYSERHSRGETSHTLQVWWARRPHSAMRALAFASLCKETSAMTLDLLSKTVGSNIGEKTVLAACERELLSQYGHRPKLLDMFGGGGTIPLEGMNLGADVSSIDVNELSVFIQRCHFEYSQPNDIPRLKKLVRVRGDSILSKLKENTSALYPLREKLLQNETSTGPITYLWTYQAQCSCGYKYHLSRRPWLTKKAGRSAGLVRNVVENEEIMVIDHAMPESLEKKVRAKAFRCPSCGKENKSPSIAECEDKVVALVIKKKPTGKTFIASQADATPKRELLDEFESEILNRQGLALPISELPKWSGIVNPALYGMPTHADFMNKRQRAVLLSLIDILLTEFKELTETHSASDAKFVIGAMTGLIDQLIDWNCRLSMWMPQNEQVGRAFCGPGIAMLWDYAETDPVLDGPANLWSKLDRIVDGVDALALRRGPGKVHLASAEKLPFGDNTFDAVVTDPPYYDNIYYSILADFFYSWKRLVLTKIEPELFSSSMTAGDGRNELVASTVRSGSAKKAHEDYCERLAMALSEAARVLRPDGVLSFVYSHASIGGWAALTHSFRNANLIITSAQPLSIERKARPRAIGSEAVNTCITFVARKHVTSKASSSTDQILAGLRDICKSDFSKALIGAGWNNEDAAWALFAQGVGLLANSTDQTTESDAAVIEAMAQEVRSVFPDFRVKKRSSL